MWPEVWTKIGKAAQKTDKQEWANVKPKLDNARRFRGIYFIGPDDGEYKETIKNAESKLEVPMEAALPCKKGTKKLSSFQETEAKSCESNKIPKTKHACIVEAYESTRQRLESSPPEDHEDHIAGEGYNSMTHYNLVHKFIPMLQAMKIPDAKAAVDKEWKNLETIPAWKLDKCKHSSNYSRYDSRIHLVHHYSSKFGNSQQQFTVTDGGCKHYTSNTAKSYAKWLRRKQRLR